MQKTVPPLFIAFSMLLVFYQSYANSAGSFSESADFCQIRTWMLWKLPGTRLFCVGWDFFISLLLSKKFDFLPERGIEPTTSQSKDGRSTIWAIGALIWDHGNLEVYILHTIKLCFCVQKKEKKWRAGNHYTVWPCWKREIHLTCIYCIKK